MIYLSVDLKIFLTLIKIEADLKGVLIRGRGANSNRGAYQNLKSYGGAKPSRCAKPKKYGNPNFIKFLNKISSGQLCSLG